MEPVNKDVNEAILDADKFLSGTLGKEKLSPQAEEERVRLGAKFNNLITQLGLQSQVLTAEGMKAPPRPPKAAPQQEELYDDLAETGGDQYYTMAPGGEEETNTGTNEDNGGEINYEIMSGDVEMPNNGTPQEDLEQENYEEPGQNDIEPDQDTYEIPEAAELEEKVEATGSEVNGVVSQNLEYLVCETKAEDVKDVIKEGMLKKLRKEGRIYLGSRYQKRYCMLRNHVLYYFKEKKALKQQGHILLPGYEAKLVNKRGQEFILTHREGYRSFQFETSSKEETEEWLAAIRKAANAPLSARNNAELEKLRSKNSSGDDDSLHYVDAGLNKNNVEEQTEDIGGGEVEEVYDDTGEELYEEVGKGQAPNSGQQPSPQLTSNGMTGSIATSPAAPPPLELPTPPRPGKSQPEVPQGGTPPAPPAPRRPKPALPPTPVQEDIYEDTVDSSNLPPPPEELENYEAFEPQDPEPAPAPAPPPAPAPVPPGVPVRPPKRKTSQRSSDAEQAVEQEKVPDRPAKPGAKPVPPVPARVDEAPPTPTEEKTNPINYANVYQALWDCATNETDELGFRRGDLIYIYEKPHVDWWIGSLFKPQGFNVGLVPKDYVMEAYEITAS